MRKSHTIILLLTVMLVFAGCQISSQRQADDRDSTMRMLKHLALGCHLYADENSGMLPGSMADLEPYVKEPYDPDDYILVASGKLREVERSSEVVLIRQKDLLPDRQQAVAYVDGHAEIVKMK